MQALCEVHYVHFLQVRILAFRKDMPHTHKDRCCWKISKNKKKIKTPSALGRLLGTVGHGHLIRMKPD